MFTAAGGRSPYEFKAAGKERRGQILPVSEEVCSVHQTVSLEAPSCKYSGVCEGFHSGLFG